MKQIILFFTCFAFVQAQTNLIVPYKEGEKVTIPYDGVFIQKDKANEILNKLDTISNLSQSVTNRDLLINNLSLQLTNLNGQVSLYEILNKQQSDYYKTIQEINKAKVEQNENFWWQAPLFFALGLISMWGAYQVANIK